VGTSVTGGLIEQVDIGGGTGHYTVVGNGSCSMALVGPPGRPVDCGSAPLNFYLMNTGPNAANFDYQLTDSLGWTTTSPVPFSGQTGLLSSGATFTLRTGMNVTADKGAVDVYRWTASISGQPSTAHTVRVTFTDTCTATTGVGGTNPPRRVLALARPAPNPFTRSTRLDYEIPTAGHVRLAVYSVTGQRIQTLVDGERAAGPASVTFEGRGLPVGIYYVRLDAAGTRLVRTVMLMR